MLHNGLHERKSSSREHGIVYLLSFLRDFFANFRYWNALPLAVLFAGVAATMLQNWNRGLYVDEAWVANSVIADSLRDMFFYQPWVQTTPPLFLLLVRNFVHVFGLSDLTLKTIPLLFALLAILTFSRLARRIFGVRSSFLATAIVAFSPLAIINAQVFKQYSGELFASCAILFSCWCYFSLPTRRHYLVVLGVICVATALSYSIVMVVPLVCCCLAFAPTKLRLTVTRLLWLFVVSGVAFGCIYLNFARPNQEPNLYQFWSAYFPYGGFGNYLVFYFRQGLEVISLLLIPESAHGLSKLATPFLALLAISGIVTGARKSRRDWVYKFYLFTFIPIIMLIALNVLGVYPMRGGRTGLFLLPCIAIQLTFSLKELWEAIFKSEARFLRIDGNSWITVSTLFALSLSGAYIWGMHHREMGNWEDFEGALRFLRQSLKPDDLVYLHASAVEPAKLYFSMWKWQPSHVFLGQSGGPCCARQLGPAVNYKEDVEHLTNVVRQTTLDNSHGQIWVLSTNRAAHWAYLGNNDFESIDLELQRTGCVGHTSSSFLNVILRQYDCR